MFDPEKVEQFAVHGSSMGGDMIIEEDGGEFVRTSDYKQLLKLYREFVPAMPCYICGNEAKGSRARVVDGKEPVCMNCWDSA